MEHGFSFLCSFLKNVLAYMHQGLIDKILVKIGGQRPDHFACPIFETAFGMTLTIRESHMVKSRCHTKRSPEEIL